MEIGYCTLDDVSACSGTVVVIDVLRAFTTAAVGVASGAGSWELVGTVEEAHRRRDADPETVLVGEVDGHTAPGFDHGNSPTQLAAVDLDGRPVVQRSTAGTQGVVRATSAARVLVTSFAIAGATARAVAGDDQVWFCVTGAHSERDGEEDRSCGEYVEALLRTGADVDPGPYVDRVATSTAAGFFQQDEADLPAADVPFSQVVDRYDVALEVERVDGRFLLRERR